MPTFDIVSEVDVHEVRNAMEQSNKEVGTRFDFKGIDATFALASETEITLTAEVDFQLQQMLEILRGKLVKRGVDVKSLSEGDVKVSGQRATLAVKIQQGIESDIARKLVKEIKDKKLKVQTAIQGDKLRVSGKKRDDLQEVIAFLRDLPLDIPLQFNNFRD